MTEPLTAAELARMRRDHVRHPQWGICLRCADNDYRRDPRGEWPCDAAKLLAGYPTPIPDVWLADAIVAREADLALDKAFEVAQ